MTFENCPHAFWEVANMMEKIGFQLGSKPLHHDFQPIGKIFCLLSNSDSGLMSFIGQHCFKVT